MKYLVVISYLLKCMLFDNFIVAIANDDITKKNSLDMISKEVLEKKLAELSKINADKLEEEIGIITKDINYYIQSREKECSGKFSSVAITTSGSKKIVTSKLTKEERKVCLLELIYFRKKYIKEIYSQRKRVLKNDHKQQIEELESIKKESINALNNLLDKI